MITDIHKIQVFYRDRVAGTLQTDPASGVCVFEYDKQWLSEGFSLSPTELPLQGGLLYADKDRLGGSFALFEDSLPDGYGLFLLEKILRNQNKQRRPRQELHLYLPGRALGTGTCV